MATKMVLLSFQKARYYWVALYAHAWCNIIMRKWNNSATNGGQFKLDEELMDFTVKLITMHSIFSANSLKLPVSSQRRRCVTFHHCQVRTMHADLKYLRIGISPDHHRKRFSLDCWYVYWIVISCTFPWIVCTETKPITIYSRLSLFRLSEVRPPRYTGHLAWHGMLAICLLHKTHPEVRPLAIPYTGQCCRTSECWLSQTRFQCNLTRITAGYDVLGVV